MLLGIIIGVVIGAVAMHLVKGKKVSELNNRILTSVKNLREVQAKLKSTRSQLYAKRTTYKKKSNAKTNGKKTARKKATNNTKKSKSKKTI